jgi:hypothetical protein
VVNLLSHAHSPNVVLRTVFVSCSSSETASKSLLSPCRPKTPRVPSTLIRPRTTCSTSRLRYDAFGFHPHQAERGRSLVEGDVWGPGPDDKLARSTDCSTNRVFRSKLAMPPWDHDNMVNVVYCYVLGGRSPGQPHICHDIPSI